MMTVLFFYRLAFSLNPLFHHPNLDFSFSFSSSTRLPILCVNRFCFLFPGRYVLTLEINKRLLYSFELPKFDHEEVRHRSHHFGLPVFFQFSCSFPSRLIFGDKSILLSSLRKNEKVVELEHLRGEEEVAFGH